MNSLNSIFDAFEGLFIARVHVCPEMLKSGFWHTCSAVNRCITHQLCLSYSLCAAVQNNSNKTELENFWEEEDGVVALLPKWPLAEMLLPRTQYGLALL